MCDNINRLHSVLQKKEIRFIFMRITIIPMHDDIASGHANILLFDKKKGILDRFDGILLGIPAGFFTLIYVIK